MTTRNLKSVLLTYEDDSQEEYEIIDEQGFHRVSDYITDNGRFIVHEVFYTYGEKDGLVGQSSTDQGH